jgi:orotidine-5'-phosphate decarboxylase
VEEWSATTVGRLGYGNVGAVVGATFPGAAAALRSIAPHAVFLIPGFGAQGGSGATVLASLDRQGLGAIVSSSRAIMYPPGIDAAKDLTAEIRRAAQGFIADVKAALGARTSARSR